MLFSLLLSFGLGSNTLFDLSVVDPQKLVCSSGHIYPIGFSLGTFLVQELIHRIIKRLCLKQRGHDLFVDNILDLIEWIGEDETKRDLSFFSCPVNTEIETFLVKDAIEFAKKENVNYLPPSYTVGLPSSSR